MPLIQCPECGHSISDKAKSCPSCGLPFAKDTRGSFISQGATAAIKAVTKPLENPVKTVDAAQLLNDITALPAGFSPGRTVNGLGTSIGGYIGIPGLPGVGIVRKYFCIFFIPVAPLDLYVVQGWSGTGGVFLGQITSDKAAKYINLKTQTLATGIGGVVMLIVFVVVLLLVAFIFGRIR
jgi:zinc-ribbon domain